MKPLPVADLEHVFKHTRQLWEGLRGQRIFITGGTGFFGKWLVESFIHANHVLALGAEATVLTRQVFADSAAVKFVHGDVRTFTFPKGRFTHVVHAAANSSSPMPHREMFETVSDGTRRMLDFAASCGAEKFLFVSSGAVYGPQPAIVSHIAEDYSGGPDTTNPASAYGEGKRVAELLCTLSGLPVTIARCFAFVGPGLPLDAHFAAGNFIRDALAGRHIHVKGDETTVRSYLYAADLALWLWMILFSGTPGRAYNVGSERELTIGELARRIAQLRDPKLDIEFDSPAASRASRYVPSTRRAQSELGLRERINLDEGLSRTLAWHSQP